MKKPTISVCLPTYNGAKFVGEAIESVLGQTFQNFELVIGDDGSTDGTRTIVASYARQDSRISYVFNPFNLGYLHNTNCILQRCQGNYVKTFAQDDAFVPSCLEKMMGALEGSSNVVLAAASRQHIDEIGREIEVLHKFEQSGLHSGLEMIELYFREFVNRTGNPSQMFFRRKDALNGFDTAFYHSADTDFALRLLEGGDFYYLAEPLIRYRVHKETTTITTMQDMSFAPDHVRLVDRFADKLETRLDRAQIWRAAIEGLINKMSNAMYVRGIKYDQFPLPSSWVAAEEAEAVADNDAFLVRRLACQLIRFATENQHSFYGVESLVRNEAAQIEAISTHNQQIAKRVADLEEELHQLKACLESSHATRDVVAPLTSAAGATAPDKILESFKKWRRFLPGRAVDQ